MSKKMKCVVLDTSSFKTRFKHQTLMQEYQELHKESEAMRNKLETMKHRKLTLLAEVRFLRRRYKYLLKNKSPNSSQEQQRTKQKNSEKQQKKFTMNGIKSKKEAALQKLLPIFDLTRKGRKNTEKQSVLRNAGPIFEANHKLTVHGRKEAGLQNATPRFELNQKQALQGRKEAALENLTPFSDLNHRRRWLYSAKEHVLQTPMTANDLNQIKRIYSGNDAAPRNPAPPVFDLNQKGSNLNLKESSSQRAPIFDLNQISGEEEEFQNNYEPARIEEPMKCLIRGGSDEQLNEVKLAVCRNVGDGSARVGKRKISWQDPVALRV